METNTTSATVPSRALFPAGWVEDALYPGLMLPQETYASPQYTPEEVQLSRDLFRQEPPTEGRFFIVNDGGQIFGLTAQQKMFARFVGALQNPAVVNSETRLQEVYGQMEGDDVWALIKNQFPCPPKFVNQFAGDYFTSLDTRTGGGDKYYPMDFPYALANYDHITSEVSKQLVVKESSQLLEILLHNPATPDSVKVIAGLSLGSPQSK